MNSFIIENGVLWSVSDASGAVVIPNNVKKIDDFAFAYTEVAVVILPDSVEEIGDFAFSNCSMLNRIYIKNNVEKIGYHAFKKCPNLTLMLEAEEKLTKWDKQCIDFDSVDIIKWGYSRPAFNDNYIEFLLLKMGNVIQQLINLNISLLRLFNDDPQQYNKVTFEIVDESLTLFEEIADHASYLQNYYNDNSLALKVDFLIEYYDYILKRWHPGYITKDEAEYWLRKILVDRIFYRED